MPRILFRNVKVFDGTGSGPFPGEVLVEGERITAVASGGERIEGDGATIVSGDGAFLIPGLVEAHAHLTWPSSVGRVFQGLQLPLEEHLLVAAYNARVLLDHGFTSAYSAGSRGERFEVALRNEIDSGYLPGPRLRASSQETSGVAVSGVPGTHDKPHDRTIEGLRAYVARMAKQGVDTIKFELSGDESSVYDGPVGRQGGDIGVRGSPLCSRFGAERCATTRERHRRHRRDVPNRSDGCNLRWPRDRDRSSPDDAGPARRRDPESLRLWHQTLRPCTAPKQI
jgi:hypothetical protein